MDRKLKNKPLIILLCVFALHMMTFVLSLPLVKNEKVVQERKEFKLKFVNPKKLHDNLKRQIVDSQADEVKDNRDAKYLSDKTRKTLAETKASVVAPFKAAKNKVQSTGEKQKQIKLSDLGFKPDPVIKAESSHLQSDVSSSNDYIKDVKLGDVSSLNTQEFKFYGFYHRIKLKLEQFWGRSLQEKSKTLFKSGRRLASDDDYMTSLQVTLNSKGEIVRVKILGTSGVRELDDAAVESFNEAGPFPNPPKELLKNDLAVIEWGFVVKS